MTKCQFVALNMIFLGTKIEFEKILIQMTDYYDQHAKSSGRDVSLLPCWISIELGCPTHVI